MTRIINPLLIILLPSVTQFGCYQPHYRSADYSYSKPKQLDDGLKTEYMYTAGMDTNRIVKLTKLILADNFPNIHSLIILRDNKLIYENYFAGTDEISGKGYAGYINHTMDSLHDCRSISKSFTSACIGIAVKQGLIRSIDEPIMSYFPGNAKYFDSTKKKITIRHLLTMTSGLEWDEKISYTDPKNSEIQMDGSSDPIVFILSRAMAAEPGSTWNYNGGGPQLLEEILWKASGERLDKYAEKNLFNPLGIKKYEWVHMVRDMTAAAWGLRLRSRDLAKFGLLYMNNGKWNDTQILDSNWVIQSLSPLVSRSTGKNTNAGYGFLFWTYNITIRNNAIEVSEANGNGGQIIFFCKPLNLLVVFTGGNYDRRDIVNNYYSALVNYIIPAVN
jgi:CubicO group peptidase (beta-lactamase class C family)